MSFGLFSLRYHCPATYQGLHAIRGGGENAMRKRYCVERQRDLRKTQSA